MNRRFSGLGDKWCLKEFKVEGSWGTEDARANNHVLCTFNREVLCSMDVLQSTKNTGQKLKKEKERITEINCKKNWFFRWVVLWCSTLSTSCIQEIPPMLQWKSWHVYIEGEDINHLHPFAQPKKKPTENKSCQLAALETRTWGVGSPFIDQTRHTL